MAAHRRALLLLRHVRRARCSARRSTPTCAARSPRTATARRSSTSPPAAGSPTPSSTRRSTQSPAACSPAASQRGDRVGIWAPNCVAVVPRPVRDRPDRRDPRQHQPGLPHARAEVRAAPGRDRHAGLGRAFKTSDYRAMIDEVRGRTARAHATSSTSTTRRGTRCSPTARRSTAERGGRARGRRCPSTTRSTSSTRPGRPASRRARRSRTTTSSTTATSSARGCATPSRTGSASRCRSITASAW